LELLIIALALGLISFIIPRNSVKFFGLIGSLVSAGIAIFHLVNYSPESSVTLYENHSLPFGMTFHIGYDGLGLLMIALTNLIIPIILLSNYNNSKTSESPMFHALVFLMQFGLLGVFSAEDGILFYIFWEFTLIPIFLILYWFGSGTNKVLLKFFIYTLIGSLGMLLSFIALGLQAKSFDYVDLVSVQLPAKEACWIMSGIMLAFAIGYGAASKPLLSNILSGYYNRNKIQVGDTIKIDEVEGIVVAIDSGSFTIKTDEKTWVTLPLNKLTTEKYALIKTDDSNEMDR
jgi:NADH-quinone oxidoreductase subunit M